MNKKGQFYLIAALVVTSILIGFITMTNSSRVSSIFKYSNLNEEIELESWKTINYGIANSLSNPEILDLLGNLARSYINNSPETNSYFLFGTNESAKMVAYQKTQLSVELDDVPQNIGTQQIYSVDVSPSENFLILETTK